MTAEVSQQLMDQQMEKQKYELQQSLKKQVEYYFSKQNLTHDSYLISQMNAQMYVPLDVILNFSKVKELTNDVDFLIEAMHDSSICSLNADKSAIKPNIKTERNTIILREIPSETPDQQVRELFSDIGSVSNVRSDVGDTWFVTMKTEDDAVKTLLALRNKTFNNAPIKARLKSENVVRSFFPASAAAADKGASASRFAPGYQAPMDYYGNFGNQYQPPMYPAFQPGQQRGAGLRNGKSGRYSQVQGSTGPKETRSKSGARKNKEKRSKKSAPGKKPVLNTTNFPPLPAVTEKSNNGTEPGYQTSFKSYAEDDIMEIVKHMSNEECELPEGKMDLKAHPAALNVVAHADLLKSQRTYSIEQAREAMRQGRPIRSDSVGSMDYESMMYGEDYTREARAARQAASQNVASPVAVAKPEKPEPQQEPHPKKGGYAAALLSSPPVSVTLPAVSSAGRKSKDEKKRTPVKKESKKTKKEETNMNPQSPTATTANAQTSPWGSKRSFVDVLKMESKNHSEEPEKKPAAASPLRN